MQWDIIWEYREAMVQGLWVTLQLSAVGIVGSTVLGVIVGGLSQAPNYYVRRCVDTYIEVLRNVPLIVKLFFIYFAAGLSEMAAAYAALILHQSAYIAELVVAGLRAVPAGQSEASYSLAHSRRQTFFYVTLPQALASVIPPLTTQYVQVIKNSSVVMLVSVVELTAVTRQIENDTFRGFEAATAVTLVYLVVVAVVVVAMNLLNSSLNRAGVRR